MLSVALVAGVTGCVATVEFSRDDLVGTWVREGASSGSTITIDDDGTWTGTDYLFDEPGEAARTVRSVSGEWELGEAAGNGESRLIIDLEFDGKSVGNDSWYVTRSEDGLLVIYYTLGDPDQGAYVDYFRDVN